MTILSNTTTLFHAHFTKKTQTHHQPKHSSPLIKPSFNPSTADHHQNTTRRRKIFTTFLTTSMAVVLGQQYAETPLALAENWGVRSFLRERFFEPQLSPEDAVARIKQTAEGLHSIRDMLETMSWRYVLFYIRLKSAYLSQDLKNAFTTLPEARRKEYVKTANELVDNMAEFDSYIRTPKVYESYFYYEKTLKSIDDLVALLA